MRNPIPNDLCAAEYFRLIVDEMLNNRQMACSIAGEVGGLGRGVHIKFEFDVRIARLTDMKTGAVLYQHPKIKS